MFSKEEAKAMMEKIRENFKKLRECKKHYFGEFPSKIGVREKLTCENCGGEIDMHRAVEYMNGYKAAGGDPEDIIKNFNRRFKCM